jgi:hypothetical protein
MKNTRKEQEAVVMPKLVTVKTIAKMVDAHRSSVRRWLDEFGIKPLAVGTGPRGAIRYRWSDVEPWFNSLQQVA